MRAARRPRQKRPEPVRTPAGAAARAGGPGRGPGREAQKR